MKLKSLIAAGAVACAAATAFADGEVSSGNTFGILKLNDTTTTNLIISVPWVDCEIGNVYVSNVVKTTGLTNGDYLILTKRVGTTTSYYSWILTGGVWQSMVLSSTDLAETGLASTSASNERIGRGNALMLHRQHPENGPVYLFGRYDASGTATATLESSSSGVVTTLIAPPGTDGTSFDLTNLSSKFTSGGLATGDTVVFGSKTYSYNTSGKFPGQWTKKEKTQSSTGIGFAQVKLVNEGDVVIEAGRGFWYQRAKNAGTATITW